MIKEKILNGEELTSYEAREAFYAYPYMDEDRGESGRWSCGVERIIVVEGRYFSVWGDIGLTEYQEDEFEPQVLPEVEPYEETIVVRRWRQKNG